MEKIRFRKDDPPVNFAPKTQKENPIANLGSDVKSKVKSKVSGFWRWLFGATKFLLGIFLLPFVYSSSVCFLNEFSQVSPLYQYYFWSGAVTLLILHLLIWEPEKIYTRGHRILEWLFSFFKPLVSVAPYLLPIYTIVLFIIYIPADFIFKTQNLLPVFIFLFGFSITLHLVFSAKTLRAKKDDFLKGNYIFGFSLVYILNVVILSFFFSLLFDRFSLINFSNQTYHIARGIFSAVFRQLFVMS